MEKSEEKEEFRKFPRTRHLFDAGGGVGRDDLLMDISESKKFLQNKVTVEEKVDGANLGISLTKDYQITFQNRSHYVTYATSQQWKGLDNWLKQHQGIFSFLNPEIIVFGEWLYAKHSIHYRELPDYFLVFDIYDKKEKKFYSVQERNKLIEGSGLHTVSCLAEGNFTIDQIQEMLKKESKFYKGPIEGVYLRIDENKYLKERAKVVRSDFLTKDGEGEVEHWSKAELVKNIVKY